MKQRKILHDFDKSLLFGPPATCFNYDIMTKKIEVGDNGLSRTIILNNVENENRLDDKLLEELLGKIMNYNNNLGITNLLLEGRDGYFCTGMDDKPLIQALKTHNIRRLDTLLDHEYISLYSIQTNPIPIITYLDGKVSNFGSKLAYSSQFRIGTENTMIGITDLNKGIIPFGLMYILSRVENGIGYYIALTGHEFKQQELYDLGIVSHYSSSAMKYLLHKTCYGLNYKDLCTQDSHMCSLATGNIGNIDRFDDYSDIVNVFKKCMINGGGDSFSELLRRLELTNTEWSKRTLEEIYSKPLVLSKLCYDLLTESRRHSYHTVCQLERQINMLHNPEIQEYMYNKLTNPKSSSSSESVELKSVPMNSNFISLFTKEDTLQSLPRRSISRLDAHMGIPFFEDKDDRCLEPTYWRGFGLIGNDFQYNIKAHIHVEKKEVDPNEAIIKEKLLKRYRQIYSNYQKKAILGILSQEEYKRLTENDYCGVDFHELFEELRGVNNDNKKDILDPTRSDFDINNYFKLVNESNIKPADDLYNEEMYRKIEKLVDEGKVEEEMLYQLNITFKNYEDYKKNVYKLKQKALLLTPTQCIEKVELIGNEIYRILYEMNGGNVNQKLAILTRLNNMKQFFGHLGQLTDQQIEVISRRGVDETILEHVVQIYYKNFALPYSLSESSEQVGPYQPKINEQNLGQLVCNDGSEKDLGIEPILKDKYFGISLNDIFKVPDIHIQLQELIPAPLPELEDQKKTNKIPEHFHEDVLAIVNS